MLSSYPQAGKNVLIKKQWMKIKINFKFILAIIGSHKRCLLAQLTSSKQNQSDNLLLLILNNYLLQMRNMIVKKK